MPNGGELISHAVERKQNVSNRLLRFRRLEPDDTQVMSHIFDPSIQPKSAAMAPV
jgi:hypothetical protein